MTENRTNNSLFADETIMDISNYTYYTVIKGFVCFIYISSFQFIDCAN